MVKFILYFLLFSFLFRLIFRFLLPLFQITRLTNQKLRHMQREMDEMQRGKNHAPPQQPRQSKKQGEYIDYEEVK
jgi:hypothetical protein